ncbi:MAG: hypothetical protein AB8G22_19185 [Saprospiraceae bacterium]
MKKLFTLLFVVVCILISLPSEANNLFSNQNLNLQDYVYLDKSLSADATQIDNTLESYLYPQEFTRLASIENSATTSTQNITTTETSTNAAFSVTNFWDNLVEWYDSWFAGSALLASEPIKVGIEARPSEDPPSDGISVCNCTNYVYLNDIGDQNPGNGKIYKWEVDPLTGDLTEVTQPNGDQWMTGLTSPHGIGTDINGDIYFGNTSGGPIYKMDCAGGTLADATLFEDTEIQWDLYNIGSYQGLIFANGGGPNTARNKISVFDPCGDRLGEICLNYPDNGVPDWGMEILSDGTILVSVGAFGDSPSALFRFTFTEDLIDGDCVDPIVTGGYLDDYESIYGVTTDGTHLYVLATANTFSDSYLLKVDIATGNLVTVVQESTQAGAGWDDALGIVYVETVDILYIAGRQDCIALVDPSDLSYIKGFGTVGPGELPKGIAITQECCPTNNNISIDTTLCAASIGDNLFLQELINCSGTICEGLWQEGGSNTGLTYNSCNNSVAIDALNACGSFTLESDRRSSI